MVAVSASTTRSMFDMLVYVKLLQFWLKHVYQENKHFIPDFKFKLQFNMKLS